jgi:hypothetical protein
LLLLLLLLRVCEPGFKDAKVVDSAITIPHLCPPQNTSMSVVAAAAAAAGV